MYAGTWHKVNVHSLSSSHSLKTQPSKQAPEIPGECAGRTLTHHQGEVLQSVPGYSSLVAAPAIPPWLVNAERAWLGVPEPPLLT